MRLLLLVPVILLFSPEADACMATNPGTTPTTTAAPTKPCASCTVDNPAVEKLQEQDANKPLTSDTVSIDPASGCALRKMTCSGNGPGSSVILEWNRGANGITAGVDQANYVEDTLICDGTNWFLFRDPPATIPVTTVECLAT